ncbi:MAG: hypothetical protein RDV48_10840 [Candidatus Eremiobacteraeota bacterium]|nr:hypothetical protein [Candidatus Eremiobacteraeota bacterium]
MDRWEYEIESYPVREVVGEAQKKATVIACDPKGVCLYRDMPTASREALVAILNERGSAGWELVQIHFNSATAELACLWKRKTEHRQFEH